MKINIILIAIILHFIFDWILQPRDIAKNKGNDTKGIENVLYHMLINILPFSFIVGLIIINIFDYNIDHTIEILSLNFTSHFLIDVLLPKGKNERQIINWTALDQILHLTILIILLTKF